MQPFNLAQVRISRYPFPTHDALADLVTRLAPFPPIVFQLPYEIFQEIFLHLPVLPWTEMYHRHLCGLEDVWSQPASKLFWERTRTLLALGATCRVLRQVVLVEAWKVYVVCPPRLVPQPHKVLLSRYKLLLRGPHLAANVRYDCTVHVSGISRR